MTRLSFAHHGCSPAFQGLDLEVPEGTCLVVEGESGAGKTTLLKLLTGLIPRVQGGRLAGQVRLDGRPVDALGPAKLPRRIGYVPQDPETAFVARTVEAELTGILENLDIPANEHAPRIEQVLGEVGMTEMAARQVATLSGGEAARAALAAALISEPDVLVLDEPHAQLDAEAASALARTLRALKAGGLTLVIAAHQPHPFEALADDHLRLGQAGALPEVPTLPAPPGGRPRMALEGAVHRYPGGSGLGPMDLTIRPGEVVALAGPNGSGKSTLLHMACGLLAPQAGTVRLAGRSPRALEPTPLARQVGVSFQHPAWHITQDTLREEVALTSQRLAEPAPVDEVLSRLDLRDLADRHPWDLSGGQRQRLAVATAIAHEPGLLLLDEPTRGLDPAGLQAFAALLEARVRQGQATVLATHHPWLLALAHRVVRLEAGRPAPSPPEPREVAPA